MKRDYGFSWLLSQLNRFSPDDQYERCGMLMGYQGRIHLREFPNRHPEPEHSFRIMHEDALAYRKYWYLRDHYLWLGWFHTHPGYDPVNRDPSDKDYEQAKDNTLSYYLWFPAHRILTSYSRNGIVFQKHIPRRLMHP